MAEKSGRETQQLVEKAFRLRNGIQALAIEYFLLTGIIQKETDYEDLGYSGAFDLLLSGALTVPREVSWSECRQQIEDIRLSFKHKADEDTQTG